MSGEWCLFCLWVFIKYWKHEDGMEGWCYLIQTDCKHNISSFKEKSTKMKDPLQKIMIRLVNTNNNNTLNILKIVSNKIFWHKFSYMTIWIQNANTQVNSFLLLDYHCTLFMIFTTKYLYYWKSVAVCSTI